MLSGLRPLVPSHTLLTSLGCPLHVMIQRNELSLWPCKCRPLHTTAIELSLIITLRVIMGANIAGQKERILIISVTNIIAQVSMVPRSSDPTTSPNIAVASLLISLSSPLASRLRSCVSSTTKSGVAPRLPKFRSSLLVKTVNLVRVMRRVRVNLGREMTVRLRLD